MECISCGKLVPETKQRLKAKTCSTVCTRKEARHRSIQRYRILNPDCRKVGFPSGTTGAIGELTVSCDLLKKGYEVFRAVSQSCSVDLAVLLRGKLYRVEVTTGSFSPSGKLMIAGKDESKYDILAIYNRKGTIEYRPGLPAAED